MLCFREETGDEKEKTKKDFGTYFDVGGTDLGNGYAGQCVACKRSGEIGNFQRTGCAAE